MTEPRRRVSRTGKAAIALVILIAWTSLAAQWTDRGCDFVPQSYMLVLTEGFTPDDNEGCEEDNFGTSYTSNYEG